MAKRKPLAAQRLPVRRSPKFAPRARFLVICEGRATEPLYFHHVRNALRDQLLTIDVPIENGDPLQLVEIAIRRRNEARRRAREFKDDNEKFDQVWCVVDVDEHERLPEAIQLGAREKISLAVSNPCFEIWPYWHFKDHSSHVTGHSIQRLLNQQIPGGKRIDCARLTGRYDAARQRAIAAELNHERAGNSRSHNPSSEVWRLIDELLRTSAMSGPASKSGQL